MRDRTWTENEYAGVYSRLETFAPKEKHDRELADLVSTLIEKEDIPKEEVTFAELGAGPAPLSKILSESGYNCKAFDLNPDMALNIESFDYDTNFDLTSTEINKDEIEKYDVVSMENVWYATSLSSEGTRKYTKQEAEVFRTLSLKKAAAMLRPGGFLILSDPLENSQEFGMRKILSFLEIDQKTRKEIYNEEKTVPAIIMQYLKDPKMKEIFNRNRKLMQKAALMNERETYELIQKTGVFEEILYTKPNTYLGSNLTMVLRKNGLSIEKDDRKLLGEPIELKGYIHEDILRKIGKFRKRIYANSKTCSNLPVIDKYDLKNGCLVIFPSKNKLDFAAVATLQKRGEIGFDAEEILKPKEGEFMEYLNNNIAHAKELTEQGKEVIYAEGRRLAADNLDAKELMKFFNGIRDTFKRYTEEENIDIVLFLAEDMRFEMINALSNKVIYKKLNGLSLNRQCKELQTIMLSGANYFFDNWKECLDEKELETFNNFQNLIQPGQNWEDIAESNPNKGKISKVVNKVLKNAKDNIDLYYIELANLEDSF